MKADFSSLMLGLWSTRLLIRWAVWPNGSAGLIHTDARPVGMWPNVAERVTPHHSPVTAATRRAVL